MPTSPNGLGIEDYLEQFPNHEQHYQDENYNLPEWYELHQKKEAAPQQQTQQQTQQPQQGMSNLSNLI